MHTHGQNSYKNYEPHWKTVEVLKAKGLAKSALEEVRKIYKLAKDEKQEAHLIKALVEIIDLQTENRENHVLASIQDLEAELATTDSVVKCILSSLLAGLYDQQYQGVRWQLYQRTATTGYVKADVSTWGTEDFHKRIGELYLASLQNETDLKQTKLETFDAIISRGSVRHLRPTLYDLLAHRALAYLSSDERALQKPAYTFEITNASAFDPAADFIRCKFESKDSASLELNALRLYQKLVAFHINDPEPDALIDVDLLRIQYVRQKSVHEQADELYLNAVNYVANQYQQTPAAAQAWYLLADYHFKRGLSYEPREDSTLQFEKVKAAAICEKIIEDNPETEGGINAYNLLNTIRKKALQFTSETVVVPDKLFLMFVEYQNLKKLYLRIVRATDTLKASLEKYQSDDAWRTITKAQVFKSWEQALPDTKDHQQHSVQIRAEALPIGEYILLASSSPFFSDTKSIGGLRLLYVSNLSYVQRENDYFVLHRDTGQPIAGATVKRWDEAFDYKTRRYKKTLRAKYTTDTNGHFADILTQRSSSSSQFEMFFGKDRLFIQEEADTYYINYTAEADTKPVCYIFTDRKLYRPGQTIYFKGIAAKGNTILKDQTKEIKIELRNANNEVVGTVSKTVNDFGSFSGTFILPQTGLNGSFSIVAGDAGSVWFNVEEYKRPRFSVQFDTLRQTYKLGETIEVTGTGTAYAGNSIANAKVVYRVVRNVRTWASWTRKGRFAPLYPMREIAHGETRTDEEGRFQVKFDAIPDAKADKSLDPVFTYTISADVTDINGETRSALTRVCVGYKSILIKSEIPGRVAADSLTSLKIRTENMNGEFASSSVNVRISRLEPENRLIRTRYWTQPDLFVMSKAEFVASFPNDEYDNETEIERWPEREVIFEKTQQLLENEEISIQDREFSPGHYKIQIIARNTHEEEVRETRYIELDDPQSNRLQSPEYLLTTSGPAVEPGEKTNIELSTSAQDIFVISTWGKSGSPDNFSFLTLDNEKRNIPISVKGSDQGGYAIDYVFVKHNRVHQAQIMVDVPWNSKQLKIEYETFRDHALPGSKEQWKIKISGYNKEQVAAEMLAGMYDASLDQFIPHNWHIPDHWPQASSLNRWESEINFSSKDGQISSFQFSADKTFEKNYDLLPDISYPSNARGGKGVRRRPKTARKQNVFKDEEIEEETVSEPSMIGEDSLAPMQSVEADPGRQDLSVGSSANNLVIRKNLNETAFFFPDLKTDENGSVILSFTLPEALTRWKFQALAHTSELAFGYSSKEVVTQKKLMVQPNAPRFFRECDQILFPVKIVNLSEKQLSGTASLQLTDPETNENVTKTFGLNLGDTAFVAAPGQSITVDFALNIPKGYNHALTWRVVARADDMSDGEESTSLVLPNRMLVTESLPLTVRGSEPKEFRFEKLLNAGSSKTLTHESVTVEYTSNPAWYAVQALPYLMEYPHECAEQTWNRYYANALASFIVKSSPKIAAVFQSWKTEDITALTSNLQKNQELKSILLEETPWVFAAKSETEQKNNIALLFDLAKMSSELEMNMQKLLEMQNASGGFPWFKGGRDDQYITQYIVTGIGRLIKRKAISNTKSIKMILEKALPYLDYQIKRDYQDLIKSKLNIEEYTPDPLKIQYLYMRSRFDNFLPEKNMSEAVQFFKNRAKTSWQKQSKYLQGMIALVLYRDGDVAAAKAILKSLRETAITSEESGMYWKNNHSWWWHEAPIERQALLIEAFQEIEGDETTVNEMKTWLLRNKQTNRWESTKATADACYALLMTGTDWLSTEKTATIQIGDKLVEANKKELGSGYFKKTFKATEIQNEMGNIRVQSSNKGNLESSPGWGAVYWQYYENLDNITPSATPLKLSKQLFIEHKTDAGLVLSPVLENESLNVGDKVVVRIELHVGRDMEYVHMKDMRASTFEPVNVLSGYKWQSSLGYYESTKDASTNFFFDQLRKGTYVFEYPLFVNHRGDFSNGITSVQCMYAPEFSAHSEGVRIKVR